MNFSIDRLSFLLGFLLASLVWFLAFRFRSAWPRWRAYAERRMNEIRERNLSGLENYLRQETIERAQRQHVAARLFSLEDLLVEPRLLAAPTATDSDQEESKIPQLIPYLPDQPLLPSQLGYPSLTMDEALQHGTSITVIARPGAGKTVALAYFAIQAARRQCSPAIANLVPIYFHIQDLDLRSKQAGDPAAALEKMLARRMLVIYQNQVGQFMRSALTAGRTLLIVDGVDELPPQQLAEASAWLKSLRTRYSGIRILTTGDPAYLGGLLSAGFIPLALACWRFEDAHQFVHRWKKIWDRDIAPQISASNGRKSVDSSLLENWLKNRPVHLTPLDWTLQTWALFAGDITGPHPAQALEAYVRRLLPNQAGFETLANLAAHLVTAGQATVTIEEAALIFREQKAGASSAPFTEDSTGQPDVASKTVGEKTRPLSGGTKTVDSLIGAGLLVKHPGDRIAFAQPAIGGFLASQSAELDALQETPATGVFCWSIQAACMRYLFSQGKSLDLVDPLISEDSPLLHTNLAWLCSFLSDSPPQAPWRSRVMRPAVQQLQEENNPIAARARLVSALAGLNDPSIAALFRQLLDSPKPDVRRLAAFGAGALQDGKSIEHLIPLLNDTDQTVQFAGCLALAHLSSTQGREAVTTALAEGSEDLRRMAAESLAGIGSKGHEALREALNSSDLLQRRAAIHGFSQVRKAWVLEILEKTAIEDGQWIVRNAATQAIETLNRPKTYLPKPFTPPSEAGWLILFASQFGSSVPRDQSPLPILLRALQEGSTPEQLSSLEYLRRSTDPVAIEQICEIASEPSPLSDAATYALWWMAASGVQLSPVRQ